MYSRDMPLLPRKMKRPGTRFRTAAAISAAVALALPLTGCTTVHTTAPSTARAGAATDVQARFADLGATLVGNSPEQFDAYVRSETKKWHAVVKAADIKLQ